MVVFKTKSGVTLDLREGGLYTTNLNEVEKALKEDLEGNDIAARYFADKICYMMQKFGVVVEA